MKGSFSKSLSIAVALCSFALHLPAEESGTPKTVRLLTVGNSFSHNATHYLGDLAKADGNTLILREDNVGGASLEVHWNKVQAFEKNPADKLGVYTGGKSLKDDLKGGHWDFVTIQQASIKSHDLATYRPFAVEMRDFIKQYAPDAMLLLHETWEYRLDDARFSPKTPQPGEPKSQDEMYRELADAYATTARELGLRRIPVGDAFHLANHDPQWGFHALAMPFDSQHAKTGELPDQTHSLNVGWNWKKQKDGQVKLGMDGHHASTAGEYLGACVWYEVLFGKSAEGNRFVPPGLDADYARFLQATAHRAIAELH
ncbi:MAG: DUF4886 domain-containing protein [Chthoniobacter sp.]|uniref:DUF4886 domain-containing protein n=1 Tax=Chthoniobacter sp. TaxID=2510640 RepID=UPI0032A97817